jgi:hypothetical protein
MKETALVRRPTAREKIIAGHNKLNLLIYRFQCVVGSFYSRYFTMHAALIFSLTAGACLGFTGDDCYGKIPFNSPVFWCLLLVTLFFLFQTFIIIEMTIGRLIRLVTVAVCGHYLAYQLYGLWSLTSVEAAEKAVKIAAPERIESVVNSRWIMEAGNVCKPYAYANMTYGHAWIIVPAIAIVAICFFAGFFAKNQKDEAGR